MTELIAGIVTRHNDSQNKIFLCPELYAYFNRGNKVSIYYGKAQVKGTVFPMSHLNTVALSSNLWQKLSIPFSHQVHFRILNNSIHIGPLVGIYTAGIHPGSHQLVGKRTGLMYRYLLAQQYVPSSYFVFGPADISYANRRIHGYFLRKEKGQTYWKRYTVPFPDVAFNRIPNRSSEKIASVIKGKQGLELSGVKIFNPNFFNKWTLHKQIYQVKKIQEFVPQTILRPSEEQMKQLLQKYKMIYLKPAGGSLGLGIIQLYQSKQGILARYRGNHHNQLKRFAGLTQALNYFFTNKSLTRYIAQQGISLIDIQNRPIDFRVHTNKDKNGHWIMTATAAKMAGKGSVTTHMRTGGKVLSYEDVLKLCFPQEYSKVKAKLEAAVLLLSEAIDERVPGYIGELGFDIGIDQSGHPWMFEANAKPGRHVFSHKSMRDCEQLTRKMVLEYALYLADFTTPNMSANTSKSLVKGERS